MKKKIIIAGLAVLTCALIPVSMLQAQPDTARVKETQTQNVYVNNTPAQQPKKEAPPLRPGEFGVRFMPTFTSLSFNSSN